MTYALVLRVAQDRSALTLLGDGSLKASREWAEARDMGSRLFTAISELCEEACIRAGDISDFRMESDLPDAATSRRIAETVARVYTGAVQVKTQSEGR